MRFSFHHKTKQPRRLGNGLYNCSVDHYWRFQQHLDCNLKVECEDGRDETQHCPFSSPACKGWVAVRKKCYMFLSSKTNERHRKTNHSVHTNAIRMCAFHNASLGYFRTVDGANMLTNLLKQRQPSATSNKYALGVTSAGLRVPSIYRWRMVSYDRTVIHVLLNTQQNHRGEQLCFFLWFFYRSTNFVMFDDYLMKSMACLHDESQDKNVHALCEVAIIDNDAHHNQIIQTGNISFNFEGEYFKCPNGQMVHQFLVCSPHNACNQSLPHHCSFENKQGILQASADIVSSVPTFTCSDSDTLVPYILVCDFRHHCKDREDEMFCQHPPCDTFACNNGQCVSYTKRCNTFSECKDDSDEQMCESYEHFNWFTREIKPPVLFNFNVTHPRTLERMDPNETCPETHFRCPDEYKNCLPVYTRCNGWYDCVDREDERDCGSWTCPSFYRCFRSTVCVHADHLCDGWPHCPHHDDEWLCDMHCPAQCRCQGHVFLCHNRFSAHLFPHLRFLDAQGSGVTPSDLQSNSYLVHLSLVLCSLRILPVMKLLNLLLLDLSENSLTIVNMASFAGLVNLQTLSLARNPIGLIHQDSLSVQLRALRTVDISHSKLTVLDGRALSNLFNVETLNLSFSSIHTVRPNSFQYTPKLNHLHLAGNPISTFSASLFKPLKVLRTLSSQSYKVCCRELMPDHFEMITCYAPRDEISSCKDLLQSATYRGFLWSVSFLSVVGNVLSLAARVCVQKAASISSFHVFVINLSMADLLMGVYVAVIGVADSLYRGQYLFYEETWKHSVACKVAGFLSLVSCEVSALIIWLITLDRFTVLRFPFSHWHFRRTSASMACLMSWFVGLALASIPLLPVTLHWDFFSQTGVCIPLPVTRHGFKGKVFSVGVFIIFNFGLFVLIASGQAFIYWSVQKNSLRTDSSQVSRDLTVARRLITVAVTDFLCWFPIGLCGLLALADIPIPGEVNVGLAIFVLPLNSALNPFMYTFNMLREKASKSRQTALLQWLESHPDYLDQITS